MAKWRNEFTDDQKKGLEMIMKSVKKKFPFIKGWKLSDTYENYITTLYIDIYFDLFELSEYLNLDIKDYYKKKYYESPKDINSSALSVFFNDKNEDVLGFSESLFDKLYEFKYDKIQKYMNNLYNYIPDKYKIYWSMESNLGTATSLVTLSPDVFIQKI